MVHGVAAAAAQTPGEAEAIEQLDSVFVRVGEKVVFAYVEDGLDMTMTYVFNFVVTSSLQNVFTNLDILPRPSGVLASFTSL